MKSRRVLLTLHLLFVAILFGVHVVLITVSLTAAVTSDESVLKACYTVMHLLAATSIRASTIGTVVTGILLSVFTSWGLFRFYWIIAKEILTLLCMVIGLVGIYDWTLKGVRVTDSFGMLARSSPDFTANQAFLFTGVVLQLLSMVAMYAISVWKPWGKVSRFGGF
ncbi:hypothetical protein [Cohnella silvisoli]|uniref:DUF2269 family protein n=1 Tax=Cohnella silvisoli TaxID=2873699 RepID=A0ABV1KQ10_9BACL|nr:hypothetical protein [Cohnella silvisoli]